MFRLSLPARSLRGRPASLRTVPDGAGYLLRKQLFWRALLVMRPAISAVEPIFLPALRERRSGWGPPGGVAWRPHPLRIFARSASQANRTVRSRRDSLVWPGLGRARPA